MADVQISSEMGELIRRMGEIAEPDEAGRFLEENPQLHNPAAVLRLVEEAVRLTRGDLRRAERVVRAAIWIAEKIHDEFGLARSWRAGGHILYLTGKHHQALERYQAAMDLFDRLGQEIEAGITLSSSLQPLAYIGRYQDAFAAAEQSKRIFERHNDQVRLARLEAHVGNILYRQDRFDEAMHAYERAQGTLGETGEPQDVAAVLLNKAVCYISLNEFAKALEAYQSLHDCCKAHPLPLLVAQADYNIAYLHYLRGEYTKAIELYRTTRRQCDEAGDAYHRALCDLDQSDLYLELNLLEEGIEQAESALLRFESMGMGYEAAKALVNLGVASFRQGDAPQALMLFEQARERFVREQNWVWPSLLDLYQAIVLHSQGNIAEARSKTQAALDFFAKASFDGKAVLCQLLLAQLDLATKNYSSAREKCLEAVNALSGANSPSVHFHAYLILGQAEEAQDNRAEAYRAYSRAHDALEKLASHPRGEETKVSVVSDKLAVYESLLALGLVGEQKKEHLEAAFQYIEQAKSRRLADLIAFRAHALPATPEAEHPLVEKVRGLREVLSWDYGRLDLQEKGAEKKSSAHLGHLRERAREHEAQLLKALAELHKSDEEFDSLQGAATTPLAMIRTRLPADAALVEYYLARGSVHGCVVTKRDINVVTLAPVERVRRLFGEWRRLGVHPKSANEALDGVLDVLRNLHGELFAPLRQYIQAKQLVIVPDDFLHHFPFHALFDGERFLIDDFRISYAPSASVYYLCRGKPSTYRKESLVLGVTDTERPSIDEEASEVAAALPRSRLFLAEDATKECLREHGPSSRFVHIATRIFVRLDNPLFSSVRFGNSDLRLFDFYHRYLPCELVGITGCGGDSTETSNGDALIGLVRGLFYSGAEAALLSLWEAQSDSTVQFLKSFYGKLGTMPDKAVAFQQAVTELRKSHPHPHSWASFALFGKTS